MKQLSLIVVALVLACPAAATAKEARPEIGRAPLEVKRSMFSGSESRIYDMGWLKPDCTTETPDIRIVTPPANGDVRFEEATSVVSGDKTPLLRRCNGKTAGVVRVFYKSKADFTGKDHFVLDVDTKIGYVQRYSFTMDVR
jgi:hypothetical protein